MTVLLVRRAEMFSCGSEEADRAILASVGASLASRGCEVVTLAEEALPCDVPPGVTVCLSMGRHERTLSVLRGYERCGVTVVNSPRGVARCRRGVVDGIMRSHGMAAAPIYNVGGMSQPAGGYWVKRGDGWTLSPDDVRHVAAAGDIAPCVAAMARRDVGEVLITEHVAGRVVKFYGVIGTGGNVFFRHYNTSDEPEGAPADGASAAVSRAAGEPRLAEAALRGDVVSLARLVGVSVFGGDCVVRADGSYALIDFNDWPSFGRCRAEAAQAIADIVHRDDEERV